MSNKLHKKKYSFFAKFWHWGFVLLFIYGVAKQVDDIKQLEDKPLRHYCILLYQIA